MSDREATHNELKLMYRDRIIELHAYKKIAKELLVMVDEWNLTKCGENSKVRNKIREFKTLFGNKFEGYLNQKTSNKNKLKKKMKKDFEETGELF